MEDRPAGGMDSSGGSGQGGMPVSGNRAAGARAKDTRVAGRVLRSRPFLPAWPTLALLSKWQPQARGSVAGAQSRAAGGHHRLVPEPVPEQLPARPPRQGRQHRAPHGAPGATISKCSLVLLYAQARSDPVPGPSNTQCVAGQNLPPAPQGRPAGPFSPQGATAPAPQGTKSCWFQLCRRALPEAPC